MGSWKVRRMRPGSSALVDGVLWYGNGANTSGDGSITVLNETAGDPLFEVDGYHLREGSAAIDEGVATDVTTDIDGDRRPLGDGPDVGADEYGDLTYVYLPLVVRAEP